MGSPSGHINCGAISPTNAPLFVECGFRPRLVRIVVVTGGTEAGAEGWWQDGMADASVQKRLNLTGVASLAVTNGITPSQKGFTIGADAALNPAVSLGPIFWIAWS